MKKNTAKVAAMILAAAMVCGACGGGAADKGGAADTTAAAQDTQKAQDPQGAQDGAPETETEKAEGAGEEKAKPAEKIKVGITVPYSGFVANQGKNAVHGALLGIKMKGREEDMELLIEDTQCEAELAVTKCSKLKEQDGCLFIMGSVTGFEGDAQADWLKKNSDVIFLPSYSATQDMTMRDFSPNMIRAGWTADQVMFNFGEYIAKEVGYKKIISIGADYSYPWGQAAGFARGFMENGGEEIKYIWYPEGNLDFSSIMTQVSSMAGDYDAVFLNDGGSPIVAFWKAWEQYGLNNKFGQIIGGTNVADTNVLSEVSDGFVGVLSASFYSDGDENAANQAFRKAFIDEYGYEPDAVAVQSYDTIRCIIRGLDAVGWDTSDQQAIIDAICALEVTDSPRGSFYFDEYHNAVQNVYVKEVVMTDEGTMANVIKKTYEDVSQFGPYEAYKEQYMQFAEDARDYPYTTKDAYMEDLRKVMGDEYVDALEADGGWKH